VRSPLIYHDAPVFGLDIGSHTVKLVQLSGHGKAVTAAGYGYAPFDPEAVTLGIISDPEPIAAAVKQVIAQPAAGKITARRTILSVPVSKVFTRTLLLPPKMSTSELSQAVQFEAEQYVPVPSADLYIDYQVIGTGGAEANQIEVLMVAAPRAIIDSYMKLFDYLDLEVEAIETGLTSITRAMVAAASTKQAALVIDFGTTSADLAIYDTSLRLTGSFEVGGDTLTQTLVKQLGISIAQANEIKYKFGIKPSGLQQKILEALKPQLTTLTTEIQKILKYYVDRSESKTKVEAMILTGGTSAMPGLAEYLSHELGGTITIGNPWQGLVENHGVQTPEQDGPMYTTAIGLARRGLLR
jgi:type IV pilus assembly protein PilM